jgi:tyrosine-protein kinase Etk/Wzc
MDPNLTPGNLNLPNDDNIDIKRYISLYLSNWYWFAFALFFALSLVYAINRYSEKVYTVSSTLLIKDDQIGSPYSNVESVIPGGDIFRSKQNLKNEMGILKSFKINFQVMNKLKDFHVVYKSVGRRGIVESRMYKECPFIVKYDSLEIQQKEFIFGVEILTDKEYRLSVSGKIDFDTLMMFGDRFTKGDFNFIIVPRIPGNPVYDNDGSNSFSFYFIDPETLASEYRNKLSITPIEKEASLVTLSVSGYVLEQEADYLNKLMEVYIQDGLDYKNETADSTIKFINKQLKVISDKLGEAERGMEEFRRSNSFFDLSREGTFVQNRLEKIENEKASFELQLQYYNYLSEYLNLSNANGTIISPSIMGITDQVLIRLVNELSAIQKEREKLGFNIVLNQPSLELMDRQIDEAREALRENIRNGVDGLKLLINESGRKLFVIKTELDSLPSTERQFIGIQRSFDVNNTVYTYLLEKLAESGIAKASNISDNRIVDKASKYSSLLIRPKNRSNFILAFLLAFILPMAAISLIDYFNDKVLDRKDVERKTKVPVIGYVSHSEGRSEIPVVEKPGSSLAESFRAVRTSIKYFVKENEKPVIAVTSTVSSEGKTFISVNLAAITAMLGKKVLLIGLDLRRPRINKVLEFDESPGMSSFLSSNCTYEEIIKPTQIKNLFYAPSGPIPPNPAELIETGQMKIFMERARKEFDYIIIDTPPVAVVTDTLLLAPYVDLNLFIVRQRYTTRNTLDLVDQLSKSGELKNLAIIINDINMTGYYGYGMRYGNYLGYGYSYGYNYYGKGYYGRYGYSDKGRGYYTED